MPYRVRPIRWDLLINPAMRGVEIEAQASRDLSRSVLGGLVDVGDNIVRARQEKESSRRFDAEQSRLQDALDLRKSEFAYAVGQDQQRQAERYANDQALLDGLEQAVDLIDTGQAPPGANEALLDLTQAVGGPAQAQQKLDLRAQTAPMPLRPGGT